MADKFSYEETAGVILEKFDQDDSFEQRFIGFCQNAMEGKAEDKDLERLISNVKLSDGEINET